MWDRVIDGFGRDELSPTASRCMRNVEFLELGRMVEGDRMRSEGEDEDREQIWCFTGGGEEDYSRWGMVEGEDEEIGRGRSSS